MQCFNLSYCGCTFVSPVAVIIPTFLSSVVTKNSFVLSINSIFVYFVPIISFPFKSVTPYLIFLVASLFVPSKLFTTSKLYSNAFWLENSPVNAAFAYLARILLNMQMLH